jgi:TorA maturation chaperone TorD
VEIYDDDLDLVNFYRLFASLFMREPDHETLLLIQDIFSLEFHDTPDEIRSDFIALFLVPEGHLPPCESLYNHPLWEKPHVWGKATEEVMQYYESAGMILDEDYEVIPDHLSAELLFMSYLIGKGLAEQQEHFLRAHLAVWVPAYCDEVQQHARTTFYQHIAKSLKEFIRDECKNFDIEMSP